MTNKKLSLLLVLITFLSINALAQKNKKPAKVLISTEYGDIKLQLYNETPLHRDNFIKLVSEGFYDSTLFHRVIEGFMIQGGDPDSKNAKKGEMLGNGGPGYTIPAEFNNSFIHKKGALAAARMGDSVNPDKASNGSQFYIVQGKKYTREELDKFLMKREKVITYTEEQYNIYETIGGVPHLDMEYTIFGEVTEGLEVIDKIAAVDKGRGDRPKEDIKMTIKMVKK
ncbi:MAG: peptidylprolyl isomerase [Vicingus serpentipes]|nr:peptidylprolyl isomerase [Vicingus serpentipes]